jgi:ureidoglycolate hydrolase
MGREITIKPQELTVEGFAPYGQAILPPQTPAPKRGDDWDCWFPLGSFSPGEVAVGIVTTRPCGEPICAMEREPKTEFLLPISGPVIQTVALPGDLSDHTQQPDATSAKAFIILPGQSIVMAPGTWHWAALSLKGEVLYYFITEPHPPEPGREDSPWISFQNGDTLRLKITG